MDLMRRFDVLESDRHLKAVAVKMGAARCGWSMGEEIRDRLMRLRARGVRIVAYMEDVTPLNYYLATACDVIAMQPQGHFAVNGFSAEVMFYRGLFDKLGVEPQFLRHGKYKSFEEPYTRTGMSDPMRSDLQAFIGSLVGQFPGRSRAGPEPAQGFAAEGVGVSRDRVGACRAFASHRYLDLCGPVGRTRGRQGAQPGKSMLCKP